MKGLALGHNADWSARCSTYDGSALVEAVHGYLTCSSGDFVTMIVNDTHDDFHLGFSHT